MSPARTLAAIVPLTLLAAAPAAGQEAAAAPAPDPEVVAEATAADEAAEPVGLAEDEAPARPATAPAQASADDAAPDPAAEPVVRTPAPLLPAADAWREDPTVVLSAVDVDLDDFLWVARPIVVFADTPADPAFQQQVKFLAARMDALAERDVVVLTDTDPDALSEVRRKLRPRGFMLAILGKDGGVKLRKPFPWDVREITHAIDKFPLRKQELRDAREPNL